MSKRRKRGSSRRGVRVGIRDMFGKLERPLPIGVRLPPNHPGSGRSVAAREDARKRAASSR